MFEYEVAADPFHSVVQVLSDCVNESLMTVVPDGMESPPRDLGDGGIHVEDAGPNKIIFTDMSMPRTFFESLDVEEPVQLGVNWGRVSDVIDAVESSTVTITYDPDDYYVHFEDDEGFHYQMAPIDPGTMSSSDAPDFTFDYTFTVNAGRMKKGIKKVHLVTDGIHFVVEDGSLVMWGRGDSDETDWDLIQEIEGDAPTMSTEIARTHLRSFTEYMADDLGVEIRMMWEMDTDRGLERADEFNLPMGFSATFGGHVDTDFYVAPRRDSGA